MNKHLAIFSHNLGDLVLSGEKTVDLRFAKKKIAPYLKVMKGDRVYVQNVGRNAAGQVEVENVLFFDSLNSGKLRQIKKDYLKLAAIDTRLFNRFADGNSYLSVIFLKNPQKYVAPVKFHHRDRRGWQVLS